MKNLTHWSLLLCLFLLPLLGGICLYEFVSRESSIDDAEISSHPAPTKSVSHFESKVDTVDVPPPPSPVSIAPMSNPTNTVSTYQPVPPPDALTLSIPGAEGAAVVPAVFAIPDNDENLNSDQQEKINEILKSFTYEVSVGSTNPDDPAYLDRWQKAQAEADDRLRMVLGQEDYLKYMLVAATMDTSR